MQSFLFSFSGIYQTLLSLAWGMMFGVGIAEGFLAYYFIMEAQAPAVQHTKNVMRVGFFFLAISFAAFTLPEMISNAFAIETPFSKAFVRISLGAALLSVFPLGGASLIAWDRWSSSDPDELEIPYWTKPSWREFVPVSGWLALSSGFLLGIRFPAPFASWEGGSSLSACGAMKRRTRKVPIRGSTSLS